MEYNKINYFSSKIMQKKDREGSSGPLFVYYKDLYEVKACGLQFSFNRFQ